MALYRLEIKAVMRSKKKCIVAAAAYRAGEKLEDECSGKVFNYRRKRGVAFSQVILPGGATADRAALWNGVEKHHVRKKAVTAREIIAALPRELSAAGQQALAIEYATQIAETYGVAVDVAIHLPHEITDEELEIDPDKHYVEDENGQKSNGNFHAHFLISACQCDRNMKFGKKVNEFDEIHCRQRRMPNFAEIQRPKWQDFANKALAAENLDVRIDHRSNKARGIERKSEAKLGPTVTALSRSRKGRPAKKTALMQAVCVDRAIQKQREYDEYLAAQYDEDNEQRLREQLELESLEVDRQAALLDMDEQEQARIAKKKRQAEFVMFAYQCTTYFEIDTGARFATSVPFGLHKFELNGLIYYCRIGDETPVLIESDDRVYFVDTEHDNLQRGVALTLDKFDNGPIRYFGSLQFRLLAAIETARQGGEVANAELQDAHAMALYSLGRGDPPDLDVLERLRVQLRDAKLPTHEIDRLVERSGDDPESAAPSVGPSSPGF